MEREVWKDVAGYEGQYEVSSFGRVKSLRLGKEKQSSAKSSAKDLVKS